MKPPNLDAYHTELLCQFQYEQEPSASKDILIVVRNQLSYIKPCIESIYQHTKNFKLYIWDNDSEKETRDYLVEVSKNSNVKLHRSGNNRGFIFPNNRLAELGSSDYIILLNSDTIVQPGWDTAMIGYLKSNLECAQCGYLGGFLNEEGRGGDAYGWGGDVDFIAGWCFCISRNLWKKYRLFDEINLDFAYGEDSDYSLRLREKGHKIYALHLNLVTHFGNKTIAVVQHEKDVKTTFENNHEYLSKRWETYLSTKKFS